MSDALAGFRLATKATKDVRSRGTIDSTDLSVNFVTRFQIHPARIMYNAWIYIVHT